MNNSRSALNPSIPLQNLMPSHNKINRGFLSFKSKIKGRKVQFPTALEGSKGRSNGLHNTER